MNSLVTCGRFKKADGTLMEIWTLLMLRIQIKGGKHWKMRKQLKVRWNCEKETRRSMSNTKS